MKKLFLIILLCGLTLFTFGQTDKKEANRPASPEMTALQTATGLIKYGYANYSPTALIEAAKILAETKVQEFDCTKETAEEQKVDEKSSPVNFNPIKLIADARKYAGDDKVVLAYADKVEQTVKASQTRGAVGGPKYAESKVMAHQTDSYQVKFWSNELAEVLVVGDGDNDLDLYIYDQNGNLVASDTDYTDQCICRWVPVWTGTFVIRIVNRGSVYSNYIIVTN